MLLEGRHAAGLEDIRRSTMRFTTKLLAGAAAALAVVTGSAAYAAVPDGGGIIHACYRSSNPNQGALHVIDTAKGQSCGQSELALDWNQKGPQGPQGPQGPMGPTGAQ